VTLSRGYPTGLRSRGVHDDGDADQADGGAGEVGAVRAELVDDERFIASILEARTAAG
jgi:hypothetical protein